MIETVTSIALPANEVLRIQKHRIMPENSNQQNLSRISIVTGIHGDELEGQFVCYEVIRRIYENKNNLTGIVDIYPALNPLGIDTISRGIPGFDLDMNRIFPGSSTGAITEQVASSIIADIAGSDLCIDIHASNIFLTELPQTRINQQMASELIPIAKKLNMDYIWVHAASTVLESTLSYSLNSIGTPTLVVEMGVGMRITKSYGVQLTEGIFAAMVELGIWQGNVITPKEPIISQDGNVFFLNAVCAGLFVPEISHNRQVQR